MDPVHREVAAFLREHHVSRAAPLLVAVSGGGDSVALLHALLGIGQRVEAAHVHHGLRGAHADADLAFVARLARVLGVPFSCTHVDAAARDGRSPEARARALRYAALERLRSRRGCPHLATAHHLDDQAETVLLRAVRGTGIAGLGAIRPSLDGGRVLRPLLAVRRADLRRYLAERGLEHRDDASNDDLAIPRNRLRADVLPALESIHPGASARLAALATLAAQADAVLVGDLELRLDAWRERARAWLGPAPGPRFPEPIRVELPSEGELEFPDRGLRLSWHACTAPDPPGPLLRLPALRREALVARSPRPDDRIFARGRERALKDLFASARWGRVAQARALIVERDGEVVWVPGLVRGEGKEIDASSIELRAMRLPSPPRSC